MAATKRSLDFTDVKDGSNFSTKRIPEGDYAGKVVKVEDKDSKNDNPMWVFTIEVVHEGRKGTYPVYCLLEAKHLWKVRALFAACGLVLPKKRLAIDPNKIVGRKLGITMEDDEYEGKVRSKISATIPLSEVISPDATDAEDDEDEDDEEEPEPQPAPRRRTKPAPAPEPEPEEEDDEEEEVEDEEEEEEEEAPPPPPRKKTTAKKAAAKPPAKTGGRAAKKPVPEVDEDELEELDIDDV